ncbi:hypothetical protein [Novosphingobium pentaromativorans]|uniref:Lipoprotein n=1 Tax=Novosphingobium pentaromativorans US6-1 TaxID=1088721 RepID=G6E6R3_9SPHN|nr:hypothetical protein [Novosphingobium pentaromativorans]AIT78438.1 hypothetical protein JI59_00655 [Novosphingobium pentaromativorans US6-1]EHJ62959.1 hypothetical protein NSU_0034 [Novosphingobium pentaromativorans US6-1]
MKAGLALLVGAAGLLAGCEAPPVKPALSDADFKAVSDKCGVTAASISLKGDEVSFEPHSQADRSRAACVFKAIRERFPAARIGIPDAADGKSQDTSNGVTS